MDETLPRQHDPSKPVATLDEFEELLRAGVASGEPRPMTEDDRERLLRRALAGTELGKVA